MTNNSLTGLDPSEVAARYTKLAHKVANDSAGPNNHDDLVQEALLEVWRVATAKPDASPVYYATAMKGRIKDIAWSGRPYTGGDSKPGPKSRPTENRVDWQDPEVDDIFGTILAGPDMLEAVEWAYHNGEIADVLSALSDADREYVVSRFWGGATDTEIAAKQGVTNKFLGNRWKRQIRPRLAEALADISGMVDA